jgi:hypothetical protein
VKVYLWWWAFLLAVVVFAAMLGASGTTRTILEVGAAVVFIVSAIAIETVERIRRERDGE